MSEYFQSIFDGLKTFLTGMGLTWKHFANKKDLVATLQYPNEKWPIADRNIGFDNDEYNVIRSRLHVDIDDCIGCLQCERACPVDCIKIDTIKPPKGEDYDCGTTSFGTQKKMIVPRFTIDMSECMYCNLCVYPCPEECIYMVGGPNSEKHDIDYEFSQYSRDGMIFEFGNSSEQEIIDIGGQSYLDKRSEVSQKHEEGMKLEGFVESDVVEDISDDETSDSQQEPEKIEEKGLTIKIFNPAEDKMARGIAKKALTYCKRNNMNYDQMADYVTDALNKYNKLTDDIAACIEDVRNYVDEEEPAETVAANEVEPASTDSKADESKESDKPDSAVTIDIKSFNSIDDKMARGSAKKAFTAAKREGLESEAMIMSIRNAISEAGIKNEELDTILDSFGSTGEETDAAPESDGQNKDSQESKADSSSAQTESLFDIKDLNFIDDKMARGTAKKIYTSGKRNSKSSSDIIDEIISELEKNDLCDTELKDKLRGLCG